MNKKITISGILSVLIASIHYHSIYDKYPNFLTSIFFPVNESIWEHNKLILISYLTWVLIQFIFFKNEKNKITKSLIACIICIFLVNIILTPIYLYILNTNDNFIITIIIYIISITTSFIITNKLLDYELSPKIELLSLVGFILLYVLLAILTYFPLKLPIFYDFIKEIYGIPPY